MAIYMVQEVANHKRWENRHNEEEERGIWAAVCDVKNRFPSMTRTVADYHMWKDGLRGKLWRILRNMDLETGARIKIGNEYSTWQEHKDGYSQGSIQAAKRSGWDIDHALRKIHKNGKGVKLGNNGDLEIGVVGYVDDVRKR